MMGDQLSSDTILTVKQLSERKRTHPSCYLIPFKTLATLKTEILPGLFPLKFKMMVQLLQHLFGFLLGASMGFTPGKMTQAAKKPLPKHGYKLKYQAADIKQSAEISPGELRQVRRETILQFRILQP